MTKAKQAPAISEAADPCQWAADVLLLRFDEAASFSGAVMVEWNANAVYDMRVALRRLRSALQDFGQMIDGKSVKRVKADLKKIAATLGDVRDKDVAIAALEELSLETHESAIIAGIGALINELKNGRERAHARIQKTLRSIAFEDLRVRFLQLIDDSLRQQQLFRPTDLNEVGRGVINARLRDFCSLADSIYVPFDGPRLHELRIAAKRLRYALDLFAHACPDKIGGFAKEISKLQTNLGELHDYDLWIDNLSGQLTKKSSHRGGKTAIPLAASWLLARFVDKRGRAYRKAIDLWLEWLATDFIDRMRTRLDAL